MQLKCSAHGSGQLFNLRQNKLLISVKLQEDTEVRPDHRPTPAFIFLLQICVQFKMLLREPMGLEVCRGGVAFTCRTDGPLRMMREDWAQSGISILVAEC